MKIRRNLIQYFQFADALGWWEGTRAFMYSKKSMSGLYTLKVPGHQHVCYLRSGTFDINTFRQVFVYREYRFDVPFAPTTIIDGGGNIGLASVYFAHRFNSAKIFCIEPDAGNFSLLKKNTEKYTNIEPIQAGIWHKPAHLVVVDEGYGHWGFMVKEVPATEPSAIYSLSVHQLMTDKNLTEIDILKIDIEGSEKEVFSEHYDTWLPHVKILVVELHDRMKAGTSHAVFNALLKYKFAVEQMGENMVCYRPDVWDLLMQSKKSRI
jgi:FkbM family methyltransferase